MKIMKIICFFQEFQKYVMNRVRISKNVFANQKVLIDKRIFAIIIKLKYLLQFK